MQKEDIFAKESPRRFVAEDRRERILPTLISVEPRIANTGNPVMSISRKSFSPVANSSLENQKLSAVNHAA